jgi:acyl-CoA thioester hydrolase
MADLTFDTRSRTAYRLWSTIPIRFADQDPLGHVNNAAIGVYFEQSRCEHLLPLVRAAGGPDMDFVLARIVIDFVKEIRYPGAVDVGLRVTRLGNKSFILANGVFQGSVCHATAEATLVFFDTELRSAVAPPPAVRAELAKLT